jgi:hypothetical protein
MNAETILQNKIRLALSPYGIVIRLNSGVFKTINGAVIKQGIPGLPDLLFVGLNGRTVWLEVKTATGRISAAQERFIYKLRDLDHKAYVVRSIQEALEAVGVK